MEAQKSLKQDWFLWLLLFLVAILGLSYYFLVLPTQNTKDKPSWIFSGVNQGSIKSISAHKKGELLLKVTRNKNGSFRLEKPTFDHNIELQTGQVNNWLSTLLSPSIKNRFHGRPDANYGFKKTGRWIELEQNGTTHKLYIGSNKPVGSGFYLRYGDDPQGPVFVLSKSEKESIFQTLNDVRRKDLFKKSFSNLQQVKLSTDQEEITYEKNGKWNLAEAKKSSLSDTDRNKIKEEFRSLLTLSADNFYDTSVPENYEPIKLTVTMKFSKKRLKLKVGGVSDGERLVSRTGWPVVTTTRDPVNLLSDLPKKPAGWPQAVETGDKKSKKKPSLPMGSGSNVPGLPGGSK